MKSKFTEVPTLDMSLFESNQDEFVENIGDAYTNFGFCCFSNHGISQQLIDNAYKAFQDFFALPNDIKNKYYLKGRLVQEDIPRLRLKLQKIKP